MGKIIHFSHFTKGSIPPDQVLENNKGLDEVFLVGLQGDNLVYASSNGDMQRMVFLLTEFIHKFFNGEFEG